MKNKRVKVTNLVSMASVRGFKGVSHGRISESLWELDSDADHAHLEVGKTYEFRFVRFGSIPVYALVGEVEA